MAVDTFTPDPQLQQLAVRAAELCVGFIKHKFGKNADYSEAFVSEVESILGLLHLSMPSAKPSEEDIEQFCSMFGSYLGETYRRNRGGEWGVSHDNTPTLSFGGGFKSFPWARVYKRLINGEEDSVDGWYYGMIQYAGGLESSSVSPPPLPKKSFWARIFGK